MVRKFRWGRVFVGFCFIALFYGLAIEPFWLGVTRISLQNSVGLKILQISDLHLMQEDLLFRSIISKTKKIHPDIVILSGDVIDHVNKLDVLENFLRKIPSSTRIATLGNWEYWSGENLIKLQEVYRRTGVTLLVNEEKVISWQGKRLSFYGMDDFTSGSPDIVSAFNAPSDFRVVIQHSPGFFDIEHSWKQKPSLCLSGHTHGGQITFFGLPLILPPGSGSFVYGKYETKDCPLFVSRGVGTSTIPFRFFAPPEIVLFE